MALNYNRESIELSDVIDMFYSGEISKEEFANLMEQDREAMWDNDEDIETRVKINTTRKEEDEYLNELNDEINDAIENIAAWIDDYVKLLLAREKYVYPDIYDELDLDDIKEELFYDAAYDALTRIAANFHSEMKLGSRIKNRIDSMNNIDKTIEEMNSILEKIFK